MSRKSDCSFVPVYKACMFDRHALRGRWLCNKHKISLTFGIGAVCIKDRTGHAELQLSGLRPGEARSGDFLPARLA